jgi:hypothetical protein
LRKKQRRSGASCWRRSGKYLKIQNRAAKSTPIPRENTSNKLIAFALNLRKVRDIMAALNRLYDHRQGWKTSYGNTHDLQTVAAARAHRGATTEPENPVNPLTSSVNDERFRLVFHGVVWGVEQPLASHSHRVCHFSIFC